MNELAVMKEVAAKLDTIAGLRAFAFPPDTVTPPAAVVGDAEECVFDETFGRGMDRLTLPVWLVIGKTSDRGSRIEVSPYTAGSGAKSMKAAIQTKPYTAFDTVRVTGWTAEVITLAAVDYLARKFTLDIAGRGT